MAAHRNARPAGTRSTAWKKKSTLEAERRENREKRERAAERSAAINAMSDPRAYVALRFREYRKGWDASDNREYLIDALELAGDSRMCPRWVADAATCAITGDGYAAWWKAHTQDLIDAERHNRVNDAINREGCTQQAAFVFVAEQLLSSAFHAGAEAVKRSYRLVRAAEKRGESWRYYAGTLGAKWLDDNRPLRSLHAYVEREKKLGISQWKPRRTLTAKP